MGLHRQVLIGPIDLPSDFKISTGEFHNPGMGGSEFHSILLALELSKSFSAVLWIRGGSLVCDGLETLSELDPTDSFEIQISFTGNSLVAVPGEPRLIAISHHPFDENIRHLPERTVAIVNVGRYQLMTNEPQAIAKGLTQHWLPVFYPPAVSTLPEVTPNEFFTVGHLSSLHPSKGFHDALKGWMMFARRALSPSKLVVMGGMSLYGTKENHALLPLGREYGDRLIKIMGGEVHPSVKFLGLFSGDVSTEIRKWTVAVLNPKAIGESENVSMKDCWRQGVPVISGNYFGHRDYMSDFPELVAGSPRKITRVLNRISKDPQLLLELRHRCFERYKDLANLGLLSRVEWSGLVESVLTNRSYFENPILLKPKQNLGTQWCLLRDRLFLTALGLVTKIYAAIRKAAND